MDLFYRWKHYERPDKPRVFKAPETALMAKYFIIGVAGGWIQLLLSDLLLRNLGKIMSDSYGLGDNAVTYFIFWFLWGIPLVASSVVYNTKQCPAYGFLMIGGFLLAAVMYYWINPPMAIYMICCMAIIILANLPSQGDYSLKWQHMLYYFGLGILVAIFNTYAMIEWNKDIWTYLQIMYLHTFMVVLISVKLEPWAHMFFAGWQVHALYYMLRVDLLLGLYNFLAPLILTGGAMLYYYKIYLPMKKRRNI